MDFPGEKLVIKMWETLVEKGIGSLLSPWQIGREGRVQNELRRQETLMLAQAEKDAADILAGKKQFMIDGALSIINDKQTSYCIGVERIEPILDLSSLVECGNRTSAYAAARSEINTLKAILIAEEQLASDPQALPARDIDEDWLFMWREYAGKTSTEDLQKLWGSVLAGEVKSPGSYSIRTLEFLKSLSKSEADLISQLARYVIDDSIAREQGEYFDSVGLTFSKFLMMQELGVVSGVESVGLTAEYNSAVEGRFARALVSHNKTLVVEHCDPEKILKYKVYKLTAIGKEVLSLGFFEPDVEYMRLVGKEFVKSGFKVVLADWRDISEMEGEIFNAQEIFDTSVDKAR